MNQKAFTLIELIIYSVIGGVVFLVIGGGLRSALNARDSAITRGNLETQVTALGQQILSIGRLAKACRKPAASQLACDIDFNVPPSGTLTTVTFSLTTLSGQAVVAYTRSGKTNYFPELGPDGKTDGNITDFTVCDCNDMTTNACGIQPTTKGISQRWKDIVGPCNISSDRFFRFRITAKSTLSRTTGFGSLFQGAFYVRNPSSVSGLVYQWGLND